MEAFLLYLQYMMVDVLLSSAIIFRKDTDVLIKLRKILHGDEDYS